MDATQQNQQRQPQPQQQQQQHGRDESGPTRRRPGPRPRALPAPGGYAELLVSSQRCAHDMSRLIAEMAEDWEALAQEVRHRGSSLKGTLSRLYRTQLDVRNSVRAHLAELRREREGQEVADCLEGLVSVATGQVCDVGAAQWQSLADVREDGCQGYDRHQDAGY